MAGTLYLCATPIGNLEDISFRALRILKEADLIAAEDTRNSIKLLNHFEIKTPMTSYHEYNKIEKGRKLVERLQKGENIACVTALTISGLPTKRFAFEAFLPAEKKPRQNILEELKEETRTIVLYEAPHRLVKTLEALRDALGDRRMSLCRELTKKHEEVFQTTLEAAIERYREQQPKGEYVLVIQGKDQKEIQREREESWKEMDLKEHMDYYLRQGMEKKEAMKQVAKDRGVSKREIYRELL